MSGLSTFSDFCRAMIPSVPHDPCNLHDQYLPHAPCDPHDPSTSIVYSLQPLRPSSSSSSSSSPPSSPPSSPTLSAALFPSLSPTHLEGVMGADLPRAELPCLPEIIEDLLSRFMLSLPQDEIESDLRFMYHMEMAFWYFQDFYLDQHPELPKLNFKTFTQLMIGRLAGYGTKLKQPIPGFETICKNYATIENIQTLCSRYRKYMRTVPVCGCIILSSDMRYCLAVRSWNKNIWNYPKGKVNKGETDEECAIREVWRKSVSMSASLLTRISSLRMVGRCPPHIPQPGAACPRTPLRDTVWSRATLGDMGRAPPHH